MTSERLKCIGITIKVSFEDCAMLQIRLEWITNQREAIMVWPWADVFQYKKIGPIKPTSWKKTFYNRIFSNMKKFKMENHVSQ